MNPPPDPRVVPIVDAFQLEPDDGIPLALLPPGWTLAALEGLAPRPHRARGVVDMRDAASFVSYVRRHATEGTDLYLTGEGVFVAVLNGHEGALPAWPEAGPLMPANRGEGRAGWRDHRCRLIGVPPSEWQAVREALIRDLGFEVYAGEPG